MNSGRSSMSHELKNVFLDHFRRHPEMTLQDFVKLLYQSTYGPRHFGDSPALPEIRKGIEDELALMPHHPNEPAYEEIGGDFVRVSLQAVLSGRISAEVLAEAFAASIPLCPAFDKASMKVFNDRFNLLLELVAEGEIPYSVEVVDAFLADFCPKGIRPLSHSPKYKERYHPHYRVIHRGKLPEMR